MKHGLGISAAVVGGIFLAGAAQDAHAGYRWWRPRTVSTTNTAPSISGSPATSVEAGQTYSFSPSASDAQGNTLTFSITNKPSWASFSSSTGRLSGIPTAAQAGSYANIVVSVSDGRLSSSLPAFSIRVATTTANRAPTISGTPATQVMAGKAYSFVPQASDADGNALGFLVSNKPAWAAFSTSTGALTGTPTAQQVGGYANIVISVSDGLVTQSLPAFSINVASAMALGTASLSWSAPTQNTDGSSLTNLAGYKIYHGLSASALTDVIDVPGGSSTSYSFANLQAGTHYFAVAAYTTSGTQSAPSAVGSKSIP